MSQGIFSGSKAATPIVLGYLPVGIAFGVLGANSGLTWLEVMGFSVLVFAGSAQFIGISLLASGVAFSAIILTTFVVNLRHLLMSTALAPKLKDSPRGILAFLSYFITDETFAIAVTSMPEKERWQYMLGLNLTAYGSWVAATAIGVFLGSSIPDINAWGLSLSFVLPAMFIALLSFQPRERTQLWVGLSSAIISVLVGLFWEGNWNIIIGAVLAAAIGAMLTDEE